MPGIRKGFFIVLYLLIFSLSFSGDAEDGFIKIVVKKTKETAPGYYSLSYKDMELFAFSSPVEALSTTTLNLQSRSFNSAIQSDFLLRGSNYEGARILLDGKNINDPQTGHHNSDIPFTREDFSAADLVSGVSPSYFGPGSIGGEINFTTIRPDKRKIVFELTGGEYGSFGQLFSATDKIGGLGGRVSFENRESNGSRKDTDFKKITSSAAAGLDLPMGSLDLNFGYQEKEFGAYDFYTPGKGYPSKEWTKTFLADTGVNLKRDGFIFQTGLLWRRHFDKFMLDKDNIRSNFLSHHRTDILSPRVYLGKDDTVIGKVGLGAEYSDQRINSTTLGKHVRAQKSIFLDEGLSLDERISLNSRIRLDDYGEIDTALTGATQAVYDFLNGNLLSLGVSRALRVPTFTELYYDDPTTMGNAGLSYEKSLSYEIGHIYSEGKLYFSSLIFLRDEENFVDWVKENPAQVKWEAMNIASSRVLGAEEQLRYEFNEHFRLNANYAYIDREKSDDGYTYKYGENYVRHLVSAVSIFNFGFGEQEVGFTYKKPPSRAGWFLLHAKISISLNKSSKIFLWATNIFNVEYQEIPGIASPGRWIEGGLRLTW